MAKRGPKVKSVETRGRPKHKKNDSARFARVWFFMFRAKASTRIAASNATFLTSKEFDAAIKLNVGENPDGTRRSPIEFSVEGLVQGPGATAAHGRKVLIQSRQRQFSKPLHLDQVGHQWYQDSLKLLTIAILGKNEVDQDLARAALWELGWDAPCTGLYFHPNGLKLLEQLRWSNALSRFSYWKQ